MANDIVISNVSKVFAIRHNKSNSLKSKFIAIFHKRYREEIEKLSVLKNINLTIQSGEAFGIIGRNGSGKSTLMRILAGIYLPSGGEVSLPKDVKIGAMIELGAGFHPELTGRENIYLGGSIHGFGRKRIDEMYGAIVEFSELDGFMDTPIKNYSSGMQARLGFALFVSFDPGLLLIDEVLAVGDEAFQKKCINRLNQLRKDGKTVVFVSHNLLMIRQLCDRVCVLDHGTQVYVGRPNEAIDSYHKMFT